MATSEKRREYMKTWRKEHRDQIKEQERAAARRKALADLASVRQLDAGICIMRSKDGREYVVGGRNR